MLLLSACGGSPQSPSSPGTPAATTTASPAATGLASTSSAAPTTGTAGHTATAGGRVTTPRTASRRRFIFLANLACRGVRPAVSQPLLPPVTRARLRAHAAQSLRPAERTLRVLSRLAAEAKRRSVVRGLLAGYATLVGLYGRASSLRAPPNWKRLASVVTAAERDVSLEARRIGLPFCSPTAPL